jgi:predicted ArsR family transcriptional regulator
MAEWAFLTNHGLVLTWLGKNPESTGLEIAQAVGITERAARRIIADLQADGYITPERVGRRNRYHLNSAKPVEHLDGRVVTVGELLEFLWRDEGKRARASAAPTRAVVTHTRAILREHA